MASSHCSARPNTSSVMPAVSVLVERTTASIQWLPSLCQRTNSGVSQVKYTLVLTIQHDTTCKQAELAQEFSHQQYLMSNLLNISRQTVDIPHEWG